MGENGPAMAIQGNLDCSVHIIVRSSTTLVPDSTATKPWFQLCDVGPFGMPDDIPEDHTNHRYDLIYVDRIGHQTQEAWKVKLEFSKCANDNLKILGYAHTAEAAERKLVDSIKEFIGDYGITSGREGRRDGTVVKSCEYIRNEEGEDVWYWWEIVEVKLRPMKTYRVQEPDREKARVLDLQERVDEWLNKVRRSEPEVIKEEKGEEKKGGTW
jgi:hypothetical protein